MNGTYGVVRPTLIDPSEDVEIWYRYMPTRNSEASEYRNFIQVESPSTMLSNAEIETTDTSATDLRLPGMYNLSLPVSIFGNKGYYTVYIKPKEYSCTIKDIGALSVYPDIKGIVIDLNDVDDRSLFSNDNLIGYRIEYKDYENGVLQRQDYYRIVTSNNRCEPMSQNLTSSNTNSNGYRFNDNGSLCFLTVTPSTSPSFKANQKPYIGAPNQRIVITNTKFDPVALEIEIATHDFDTISYMLENDQIRSLDKGTVTTYNDNGEIYIQSEHYTVKNNYNTNDAYEVRLKRVDNIDTTIDYDGLTDIEEES